MSVKCSAAGQYIRRVLGASAFSMNAPYTLCFWMKHNASTGAFSSAGLIHNNLVLNNADRAGFDSTTGSDNTLGAQINGNNQLLKAPTVGQWMFVYVTGANNNQFANDCGSAYKSDPTLTDNAGSPIALPTTNANYVTIAQSEDTTPGSELPYSGSFCYVGVWTAQLNTTQLLAQKSSTTPLVSSGLVLFWPLTTATDTTDLSGNGNAPTINGAVTTDDDPLLANTANAPWLRA